MLECKAAAIAVDIQKHIETQTVEQRHRVGDASQKRHTRHSCTHTVPGTASCPPTTTRLVRCRHDRRRDRRADCARQRCLRPCRRAARPELRRRRIQRDEKRDRDRRGLRETMKIKMAMFACEKTSGRKQGEKRRRETMVA